MPNLAGGGSSWEYRLARALYCFADVAVVPSFNGNREFLNSLLKYCDKRPRHDDDASAPSTHDLWPFESPTSLTTYREQLLCLLRSRNSQMPFDTAELWSQGPFFSPVVVGRISQMNRFCFSCFLCPFLLHIRRNEKWHQEEQANGQEGEGAGHVECGLVTMYAFVHPTCSVEVRTQFAMGLGW